MFLLIGNMLFANLEFNEYKLEKVVAEYNSELISFDFPFKNTSERKISIVGVKTNCTCLTSSFDKRSYMKGEGGLYTANFKIGDRIGLQEKDITIITDDPAQKEIKLKIKLDIKKACSITPPVLLWKKDEKSTKRESELAFTSDESKLEINGIATSSDNFNVEIKKTSDKLYKIQVTPVSTSNSETAKITIGIKFPNGTEKLYHIHLLIR